MAVELKSCLADDLAVELPLTVMLQRPSIAQVAGLVLERAKDREADEQASR